MTDLKLDPRQRWGVIIGPPGASLVLCRRGVVEVGHGAMNFFFNVFIIVNFCQPTT